MNRDISIRMGDGEVYPAKVIGHPSHIQYAQVQVQYHNTEVVIEFSWETVFQAQESGRTLIGA